MSATVTYKGQTLTTVQNTTATLETAGTWLEDDITITDTSSGGSGTVTVIDVPDSHGGIIKQITAVDISDTTAQAEDVASGEVFYTADGTRTVGTASGGGGVSLVDIFRKTYPSGDVVIDDDTAFDIPGYFFQGFTGITSFSSNKARRINGYAFQNCSNMSAVNCPSCTQLDASCFENCSALATVKLSNSYAMSGGNQFRACTSLVDFLCWASGTATNMFYGCSNLESVDMAHLSVYNVAGGCFSNCAKLKDLVLRKTSGIVALANISAFNGSPFASGGTGGTLYVPSALISSYQSATNWSTILGYANNSIQAIEGSTYETHYADGTVIE